MSSTVESPVERAHPGEAARDQASAERGRAAPSLRELLIAAAGFVALGALLYARHAIRGGFIIDDWSNYVVVRLNDDGFWADVKNYAQGQGSRPLMGAYFGALMNIFGIHMGPWLAWTAGLAISSSFGLYWLLRLVGFRIADAAAPSALLLALPGIDSIRLWITAGGEQLAIGAALFGFVAALLAFRARARAARVLLHALSLALFVTSLLMVEMALPVMLLSGLVYLLVASRRAAMLRWAVDVVVLLGVVLALSSRSAMERQPVDGMISHARAIFEQGWTFLGTAVIPLNATSWMLWLALLSVPAAAAIVVAGTRRGRWDGWDAHELVRWLVVLGAGLVVAGAAYAIYVPATSWYVPLQAGIGNRVNGVAAIGWLLSVYAWLRLLALLVVRPRLAVFAAPVVALLLGAVYVGRTLDDARAYQQAFTIGQQTLTTMRGALVDPPPNAMVYAFGQPLETKPGVPVFHTTWDLTSAARVLWSDVTIRALPAFPALTFSCERSRIVPDWGWGPSFGQQFISDYRHTFFIDTRTGTALPIKSRKACEKAAATWQRSPAYAPPPS